MTRPVCDGTNDSKYVTALVRVSTCYAADVLKCSRFWLECHPSFRQSDHTVVIQQRVHPAALTSPEART